MFWFSIRFTRMCLIFGNWNYVHGTYHHHISKKNQKYVVLVVVTWFLVPTESLLFSCLFACLFVFLKIHCSGLCVRLCEVFSIVLRIIKRDNNNVSNLQKPGFYDCTIKQREKWNRNVKSIYFWHEIYKKKASLHKLGNDCTPIMSHETSGLWCDCILSHETSGVWGDYNSYETSKQTQKN